ncbi:MAG: SMP-30/gluconolactonase/LRE family protein [Steroidobacteraceae bacterium]
MRRWLAGASVGLLTLLALLLGWPGPIDPVAWEPEPARGLVGGFAAPLGLDQARRIEIGEAPEDVALGPDGALYTGLLDGRIMRIGPDGEQRTLFANTGGRPLGMQFDAEGRLIVADAARGLLAVSADGSIEVLVDSHDGQRLGLIDDLDIAEDGTIWFSSATQRFPLGNYLLDFLEGRPTGMLLAHDPETGHTRVALDGLRFANGVALGPEDAYVLVTETPAARITRLWIAGPRAGERDTFITGLPGLPDNLSFDGRDRFWVALPATRVAAIDRLAPYPRLRKLLAMVPKGWLSLAPPPLAWVAAIDLDGRVVASYRDASGRFSMVTSANDHSGTLYLGSIGETAVLALPLQP